MVEMFGSLYSQQAVDHFFITIMFDLLCLMGIVYWAFFGRR